MTDHQPSPSPWRRPADLPARIEGAALRRFLRTRWPQGIERTMAVDGLSFPVLQAGQGPAVVFVHGLGHDLSDWAPLFSRRADKTYIALDLPGFGCADLPLPGAGLSELVAAVAEVVKSLDEAPLLVGSSLGGHVVQLAALSGVPCRGLMLVGPGGYQSKDPEVAAAARQAFSSAMWLARTDAQIRAVNDAIYLDPAAKADALVRRLALPRSELGPRYAATTEQVVGDVFDHLVHERALALPAPVSYVFGARDVIVPRGPVETVAWACGAPVHVVEGAGHVPMVDAPDAAHELLMAFDAECLSDHPAKERAHVGR